MSKCLICGNELLTGDIHWEQGMCNVCWNKTYNKESVKEEIKVDKELLDELIAENADLKLKNIELKEQLAEKEKEIRKQVCSEIRDFICSKECKEGMEFILLLFKLDQIEQGE